jgi:hypothetical protein
LHTWAAPRDDGGTSLAFNDLNRKNDRDAEFNPIDGSVFRFDATFRIQLKNRQHFETAFGASFFRAGLSNGNIKFDFLQVLGPIYTRV